MNTISNYYTIHKAEAHISDLIEMKTPLQSALQGTVSCHIPKFSPKANQTFQVKA
jgi:hypothetical protein